MQTKRARSPHALVIRNSQVSPPCELKGSTFLAHDYHTKVQYLDEMVQLFNFHESGSVLVVNHEAKLEHVRHAKAAKRAHCLDKFAGSCPGANRRRQREGMAERSESIPTLLLLD